MSQDPPPVRVRFAPSPTGYLHIGGLRTALYNYCLAKRHGGVFILRIEDTDRKRFVEDAESDLTAALDWAGLTADESPSSPGGAGPYRQSERQSIYRKYVDQLLEQGHAYLAFDSPEEIDAMKQRLATESNPSPRYNAATRGGMRNALSLPAEKTAELLGSGSTYVVRLLVEPGREIAFDDEVRGRVSFMSDEIDDQVLLKSDGMPTYHLANVVDDALMGISHVIRGEEWLSSTPKHVLLYEALGWPVPTMAHLPLILSPTGGKLSKRNAEKQGIPVLVRDYRAAGYEPEALVNYLALLGWNPGDEREFFNLEGLTEAFGLDRVGSAGVKFDMAKLDWFNQQHIMALGDEDLCSRAASALAAAGRQPEEAYLRRVALMMRERITRFSGIADEWAYFFEDPAAYDAAGLRKRWKPDSPELLTEYAARLQATPSFSAAQAEEILRAVVQEREAGAGRLIHPTRLALSGVTSGPGLFEMMEVLGRESCIRRIRAAIERIPSAA